ncbi:MAG: glycosyltransferase family 4 protein [Clostridia bacterium]|nr:glycosyltransferase family 4 protein [Clostridia bacterium]
MSESKKHADIVFITDNSMKIEGGEKESLTILLNGVSRKYKLAVIQPGSHDESLSNVPFYHETKYERTKYLIRHPFAFLSYIFKVGRRIREIAPRVIHSNSQVSFFMVMLLCRLRRIPRDIVFIHTDRGLYTKYNGFFRWLFQFSFKYLDVLVTTTEFNRRRWEEANRKKGIRLQYKVIGNTAGEIYETIDEARLPNNDYLTIGFAGRMCDWKDWPLAERICEETDRNDPTAHYVMYVVCIDPADEAETKAMFERMASKYGDRFRGRINVPFKEMEDFYYDIDVFVLTSWPYTESFGRTLAEAMSRETAVLTTDAGGAVEVVSNPATVHGAAKEFADHILLWSRDREQLALEKKRNFRRVKEAYTLEKNISGHLALYSEAKKIRDA